MTELPRLEVIHELPEHELTCACSCRKEVIGDEISEQLDIVPMQVRVIKNIRKIYSFRDCEVVPVTADKPDPQIEKNIANSSVLPMWRPDYLVRHRCDVGRIVGVAFGWVTVDAVKFRPITLSDWPAILHPFDEVGVGNEWAAKRNQIQITGL